MKHLLSQILVKTFIKRIHAIRTTKRRLPQPNDNIVPIDSERIKTASRLSERTYHIVFSLLLICVSATLYGSEAKQDPETIILNMSQDRYIIGNRLSYFEDHDGNLKLNDIINIQKSNHFLPVETENPSFGYTRSAFWARFEVQNPTERSIELLLLLAHPFMRQIDLYYSDDDLAFQTQKGGVGVRRTPQEYKNRNHIFKLEFKPESVTQIYMRFENGGPMSFPLSLITTKELLNRADVDRTFLGLFYGVFFALLIYNLTIFFFLKNRSYLYYVIHLAVMIIYQLSADGIGYQHIWRSSQWFSVNCVIIWNILIATYINFSRSFLNTKENTPRLDKLFKLLMVLLGLNLVFSLVGDMILSLRFALYAQVIGSILLILASFLCLGNRYRPARFYAIATFFFLSGSLLTLFKNAGLAPNNIITIWGVHWGSTIELLLLSIGLADRINKLRLDKIAAQKASIEAKQASIDTLETTEKRINQIFNNAVEGIFQCDSRHQLVFANPAMARLFDFESVEELLESKPYLAMLFEKQTDFHKITDQLSDLEIYIDYQTSFVKKNGESFIGMVSIRLINETTDRDVFAEGMILDVTDRMLLEKAERDLEIAEKSNQAKSEFLANITHELRTPMHVIMSYTQLGVSRIKTNSQEKTQKYFQEIEKSSLRLLRMVNDLLDYSKLEANAVDYQFYKSRLTSYTQAVIRELSTISQPKEITVRFDVPTFDDTAEMDGERVSQVIRNLLANAIRFSPQNSTITIEITENEDSLLFSVSDKGVGIPEDELEAVFEQFVQSTLTRRSGGGTGLGLSISKKIVEDHGGTIWAANNPNGGATFYFRLPRFR